MERQQIAAVVQKYLIDIVGDLTPADIDMSKSMKELGANSLDIVEVVSCAMRELKVKVPRSELNKLTTVDGLVDLLHQSLRGETAS